MNPPRSPHRTSRSLTLFLSCALASLAVAAPAPKPKEQASYGVYMQNRRIGSMKTRTFEQKVGGKPGVRVEADTDITLKTLGEDIRTTIVMSHVMAADGKPVTSTFTMSSGGRTTRVDARFQPTRVVCRIDAGGTKSQKIVPIPKGVTLIGDPDLTKPKSGGLKVGQKETAHFFEPLTLSIQKLSTEVLKTEVRTIRGKPTRVFLIRSQNSINGESQSWVDAKGELLEDSNSLGIRIVRDDLGPKIAGLPYEPPKDFAVATSVMTAVKIPTPRKTNLLRLRVSGIPDGDLVLSDVRQTVEDRKQEGDAVTATFRVRSRELPTTALPLAAPGDKGAGLGDATYLSIHDPAIKKQAEALAKGATDRAVVARRARAWVHGHMQKPSNIGTPRSAVEIMRTREGVCRDYASLFAAVARAAGVPTRLCSGIVYMDGSFYYHAWVECQLQAGDDGWYAFDPTLPEDFVDATHVKFAQGDPLDMYGAVRVVGQIKAEVLEFGEKS